MVVFPNAKINLGLNVISKRADGFHNIESCFLPVPWSDGLEILPSSEVAFTSSGIDIPGASAENLCVAAYHLLRKDHHIPPVKIHLHKNIPIGAGMGGGSSDAAFTIKTLNDLFNLCLSEEDMEICARKLGSDCAFFIRNKPVIAIEKGDKFDEVALDLSEKFLCIVYPGLHISTKEAYSGVKPIRPVVSIKEIINQPIKTWKDLLHNDFEDSLFPKYPQLANIKQAFYEYGALYASMTGSGSACYGIFETDNGLDRLFANYTSKTFKL